MNNWDCSRLSCENCGFWGHKCWLVYSVKNKIPVTEGSPCGEKKVIFMSE